MRKKRRKRRERCRRRCLVCLSHLEGYLSDQFLLHFLILGGHQIRCFIK
jgi:hypothetical protein